MIARLTLVAVLVLGACAGIRARESGLMPVMASAYRLVVAAQVAAAPDADLALVARIEARFLSGLDSGDRIMVIPNDWGILRALALAGISHRLTAEEIGPNGAAVLRETIAQIDKNMQLLMAR